MPVVFVADGSGNLHAGQMPVLAFRVLERDEDHGVLSLLGAMFRPLPYLRALEEVRVALFRLLEERLEHVHRERLAEAARAREDGNRSVLVEKAGYELRLVGVPVVRNDMRPVAVAHRKRRKLDAVVLDVPFCHVGILPHRREWRNCKPGLRSHVPPPRRRRHTASQKDSPARPATCPSSRG